MQIRNRKNILLFFLLSFCIFHLNLSAEEFNISAKEILIDKENEIVVGKGAVEVRDSGGKIIYAGNFISSKKNIPIW